MKWLEAMRPRENRPCCLLRAAGIGQSYRLVFNIVQNLHVFEKCSLLQTCISFQQLDGVTATSVSGQTLHCYHSPPVSYVDSWNCVKTTDIEMA